MRSIFASDEENMVRAIKSGVWMLNSATYVRRNIELLRSYGLSDKRIQRFREAMASLTRGSELLEYFMKELVLDPAYLASHPVLLKYSLENRIFPRNVVLMVLKESRVKEAHLSFWTAMYINDAEFLRRFVLKYKDMAPDLCDVYFGYKANSPVKAVTLSNLK